MSLARSTKRRKLPLVLAEGPQLEVQRWLDTSPLKAIRRAELQAHVRAIHDRRSEPMRAARRARYKARKLEQ